MDRLHWGSRMESLGTSLKRNHGGDGRPWSGRLISSCCPPTLTEKRATKKEEVLLAFCWWFGSAFIQRNLVSSQGLREGEVGGDKDSWAHELERGPIQVKSPLKLYVNSFISFGDNLISAVKRRWKSGEDLFFEITQFQPKKALKIWRSLDFGWKKRWKFEENLFFIEITWFQPEKALKISRRPFFFLRSHHFSNQKAAFFPCVLDFTKPQFRHIWAVPGPTFGFRRPCLQCALNSYAEACDSHRINEAQPKPKVGTGTSKVIRYEFSVAYSLTKVPDYVSRTRYQYFLIFFEVGQKIFFPEERI